MTNILLHGYYYRYRSIRKDVIRPLVDTENYSQAQTQLTNMIAEHQLKFPDSDQRLDFNYGEKIMINHALRHLNTVIDKNDPSFRDENGITRHQSDIVKEALERVPKSDYNDD